MIRRAALAWLFVLPLGVLLACAQEAEVKEDPPAVLVGLEVLQRAPLETLPGRRLGLVVHAASVTDDGRHAIDVLRSQELQVVRLFSPEHGLRGRAAAGQSVASGRDSVSGLPVVSLYGRNRRPAAADLQDLDALVFDLQGAGVRFYTYVSTMILCLRAAAEADLEFVVLDRPNPLGGERVEGPVADRLQVEESFVNMAPGPLVHGLTMGEMARLVNAGLVNPARLTVVPMQGWRRSMTWAETGRRWISPSPNLRSPGAALAYPGVALLEATNVSEGRGTQSPFLLVGAPWLEGAMLKLDSPGFLLENARFVPQASAAAPRPKFLDRDCFGLRIVPAEVARAQPYRLGVSLLSSLRTLPDFSWLDEGRALDRLVGTPALFAALEAGASVEEIVAADFSDHLAWREERRPFLIY